MSQHPSLKTSKASRKHRSVLKRYERYFALLEKGALKNGSSVFGMPKLKISRTKVRKEKAEEKPEELQGAVTESGTETVARKETESKPAKKEGKEKK